MNSSKKGIVTDMTTGDPVRHILYFAIPIFLGNMFQQVYNIVDTMVAGYNLGDQAIAAIGATASLYSLLIDLNFGLNNGYGVVLSQAFGAHDKERMRQAIATIFVLNAITAVLVTMLSLLFMRSILAFMNTPTTIMKQTYKYISIICGGLIGTICYNMFAAILRSLGNSRTPLFFLMFSSITNILLDLIFVVGFKTGIAGAAFATVLAQLLSSVLCAILFLKKYREYLPNPKDFHFRWELVSDLLSSGAAMAMMFCVVDIGSVIFMRANNLLGETFITSYIAARRIIFLTAQPFSALSNASAVFVGQNWGANQLERIVYGVKRVLQIDILWSVIAGAILFIFGRVLVQVTTNTSDLTIIHNAVLSIRLNIIFYPCLGVLLTIRTAMQSTGRKISPIMSSSIEMGLKVLSAFWLIPKVGFWGTCITEPATWLVCMLFLLIIQFLYEKNKEIAVR